MDTRVVQHVTVCAKLYGQDCVRPYYKTLVETFRGLPNRVVTSEIRVKTPSSYRVSVNSPFGILSLTNWRL